MKDILIVCVDGLSGFPAAIESVYPHAKIQLCIVHMIRSSVKYVIYLDRKELCGDLKMVYSAVNEKQALKALGEFKKKWDAKYPTIYKSWHKHWENYVLFLNIPMT